MSQEYIPKEPKEGTRIGRKPDIKDMESMEELKNGFVNGHNNIEEAEPASISEKNPSIEEEYSDNPEETLGSVLGDRLQKIKENLNTSTPEAPPKQQPDVEVPPLNYTPDQSTENTSPDVEVPPIRGQQDKAETKNPPESDWNKVLRKDPIPPTYKKGLEDILASRQKEEAPFKDADLDKSPELAPEPNLDLSSYIENKDEETPYEAEENLVEKLDTDLPPEIFTEITENLASDGLIEDIEKVEARAKQVMADIESLPDNNKEKIIYGLNTLGYRFDKRKNEIIANILDQSVVKLSGQAAGTNLRDQSTLTRFLHGLALGRHYKAEQAEKTIARITQNKGGLLTSAGNIGRPVGTVIKIGLILNDIGAGAPLRSVML
ncbi:MAG: hypothetical protein WDZ73_00525, partial [Candidatus Paceibacterota bacterium]